jgi:signal transduction histidine kinase
VLGPATCSPVNADPDKIRQVLINLVSNAIKFTSAGGHIRIEVEEEKEKGTVRLSVEDTGIGIAEADQVKIFSKFEQVRTARQSISGPKGTGLGLAISRALIELHGQSLSLQSRIGKGSAFSFALPLMSGPPP